MNSWINYETTGLGRIKARQTAEDLLRSPVKVESSATREIISEMEKLINESPFGRKRTRE